MGALNLDGLPPNALLLLDSAPIIYAFENHPEFAGRFAPIFDSHAAGRLRFAVTTVTIAEILTGALQASDEAAVRRYRSLFETWRMVPLDADIAEQAARLRAVYRLKLPDAVSAASALAINADALVTHDRDFSRLRSLRVIS